MADKLIGNLITGDHVAPGPAKPLKQKMTFVTLVVVAVSLVSFLVWKFINYREESQVTHFLQEIAGGRYDRAYASWDGDEHYKMKEFLEDFGKDGYYARNMQSPHVVTSRGQGGGVIVCVELNPARKYLPVLVNKDSLKLSYSPVDKCN